MIKDTEKNHKQTDIVRKKERERKGDKETKRHYENFLITHTHTPHTTHTHT
jgi:hypothetical protein